MFESVQAARLDVHEADRRHQVAAPGRPRGRSIVSASHRRLVAASLVLSLLAAVSGVLALGLDHRRRHLAPRPGPRAHRARRPTASSARSPRRCAARRRQPARPARAAAPTWARRTRPERARASTPSSHPHRHHLRRRLLRLPGPQPGALRRQRRVRRLVQLARRDQRPQDPARPPRRQAASSTSRSSRPACGAGLLAGRRRRRLRQHRPGRPPQVPAARLPRLRGHPRGPRLGPARCRPPTVDRTPR